MRISLGNTKIGRIPNISFPPVLSCRPDAPCTKECYARNAWRMYSNVREAWGENYEEYLADHLEFFQQILNFLKKKSPKYFRWFVSGDIPDVEFFEGMKDVCRQTPDTVHLIFTKRYDLDLDVSDLPPNLRLFLSEWPGIDVPDKFKHIRRAHFETPIGKKCSGACKECMFCFDETEGDVYFKKH
ncbi:MAG: hypothetical protein SVK08_00295 [Halobacteriota archaeon]|nr:hypothetical protein [Halobacteriota archaeon]